jgi:hypothetical protein
VLYRFRIIQGTVIRYLQAPQRPLLSCF